MRRDVSMDHEVRLAKPQIVEIRSAVALISGLFSHHLLRQANEHVLEVHKLAVREMIYVNLQVR